MVASDFGSDYRTHTHVTSEALYAGLTRGGTWRPRLINLKDDPDTFTLAYNVDEMPIWFLPGIFIVEGAHQIPDTCLDTTAFNVVHEVYPSTSQSYVLKKGKLAEKGRPYHVPTYGTIQAITPDQRLLIYGFSPKRDLVAEFAEGQTFLLGKKRTMFQVISLSDIIEGRQKRGQCETWWLELPPHGGTNFARFEILAATMRYIILRGTTKEITNYIEFPFPDTIVRVPNFYLETGTPGVQQLSVRAH